MSWGYCSHNGPDTWCQSFPVATGPRQSPIDIITCECIGDDSLQGTPLRFEYTPKAKSITNTGYGWKVTVDGKDTVLEGGPLSERYRLEQYHCHWGATPKVGSEHTVNGSSYPAEIHLVHWNCDKYSSFDEAVDKEDGLAVLGIFFKVGQEHQELSKVVDLLKKVAYKDDNLPLEQDIDPTLFIPKKQAYWTYPGSLTTPPCLESVTWIVLQDPVEISAEQLDSFRKLLSYGRAEKAPEDEFGGKILANFRPPLDVGNRTVRSCEL